MLCYVMLCYVMLCYVMLCDVMLCDVMLCYVMLCHVVVCYVMTISCYVNILRQEMRIENCGIQRSDKVKRREEKKSPSEIDECLLT